MPETPVNVAILVFPETSASVIYGLYDLFLSAGRDWGVIIEGSPGAELIRPRIVARVAEPFEVNNGVQVRPDTTLAQCPAVDIICVPEVNLPPEEPLTGRYREEVAWLAERYHQGTLLAAACSGVMLFAEAGLLDGQDATTHWAWCDVLQNRVPQARVHALRLEEAKQMLEAGDEPVEAVVLEVGYEDAGYFSRLFRRRVQLTPAQYRKRFGTLRRSLSSV